jgi:decaprenyl-phosphate phosphoribosyltransferase
MRPRQWVKNILVFAAPVAAGVIGHPGALWRSLATFVVFVAASASTYLLNDVIDKPSDELHPIKKLRPVASGQLPVRTALFVAALLVTAAMAGALALSLSLAGVVAAYLAITISYSLYLKRLALIELACVVSGFTLRAVAGGAANHVPISPWFLVMTSFGALLIVAGKRSSEQQVLGDLQGSHRSVLTAYPAEFLRGVRLLAMAVTVTTYCLWAFERGAYLGRGGHGNLIWFELSIIPFVLAVLAIELGIMRGRGGEPEEMALSDRSLQVLGLIWVLLVVGGIYT